MTHQIVDEGDSRKYYSQIPNAICDMGLSVYAQCLYVQLKRSAGEESSCYKSADTLAKLCGVSKTTIARAKVELENAGLIRIEEVQIGSGRAHHKIYIIDIWAENIELYRTDYTADPNQRFSQKLQRFSQNLQGSAIVRRNNPIGTTQSLTRAPQKLEKTDDPPTPCTPLMAETTDLIPDDLLNPNIIGENSQVVPADGEVDDWDKLLDDPTLSPERWAELAAQRPMKEIDKHTPHNEQEARARIVQALQAGDALSAQRQIDLSFVREGVRPLARAFVNRFGRGPLPSEKGMWIREFDCWSQMNLKPADIETTMGEMTNQHLAIKSPKSVTGMAWDRIRRKLEAQRPYQPPVQAIR